MWKNLRYLPSSAAPLLCTVPNTVWQKVKGQKGSRSFFPQFTCFTLVFFLSLVLNLFLSSSPPIFFLPFPPTFFSVSSETLHNPVGTAAGCCSLVSLPGALTYGSAIQKLQRRRIIKNKNLERSAEAHKAACWWSFIPGRGSPILCSDWCWQAAATRWTRCPSLPSLPKGHSASPPTQRRQNPWEHPKTTCHHLQTAYFPLPFFSSTCWLARMCVPQCTGYFFADL